MIRTNQYDSIAKRNIWKTFKIIYQKAKYQENPEVQLAYEKCKYLRIAKMKKDYQ